MLFDYNDLRAVRPIAENIDASKRIAPYMVECENLDIIQAITPSVFTDILEHKENYDTLLNGGFYDNGNKHIGGLKMAFGYLTYARFLFAQGLNVTSFGAVQKTSQFSENASETTIVRNANEAKKIGEQYLAECVEYLGACGCYQTKSVRKRKFIAI